MATSPQTDAENERRHSVAEMETSDLCNSMGDLTTADQDTDLDCTRDAILYNIPEPKAEDSLEIMDNQLVTNLGKKFQVPDQHLAGLKTVRVGGIRKSEKKVSRPVRARFNSFVARNEFIRRIESFRGSNISTEKWSDEVKMEQIEVIPCNPEDNENLDKKKNWYQKNSLFKWVQQKYNR